MDLYGNILEQESYTIPFQVSSAYCEQVGQKVNAFTEKYAFSSSRILGAAIAIQGLISTDGSSVSYGRVLDHTGMKLSDFARHIPYPCRLEHDSKAAGYLETWHQEKFRDSIVVLLNQNLGGAVILDGKVHNGLGMHSGSIEHMCINPDGPLCYCGERGCLETYCSADSLERAAGTDIPSFFAELRLGNPAFSKIWKDYLRHLAFAVCSLNVVLDCYVIISGYLAPFFLPEDLELLTQMITDISPFKQQKDFIFLSSHGQLAPPVGALSTILMNFCTNSKRNGTVRLTAPVLFNCFSIPHKNRPGFSRVFLLHRAPYPIPDKAQKSSSVIRCQRHAYTDGQSAPLEPFRQAALKFT